LIAEVEKERSLMLGVGQGNRNTKHDNEEDEINAKLNKMLGDDKNGEN
jgi:hypothetical protein